MRQYRLSAAATAVVGQLTAAAGTLSYTHTQQLSPTASSHSQSVHLHHRIKQLSGRKRLLAPLHLAWCTYTLSC
jgi:hypothetical protein